MAHADSALASVKCSLQGEIRVVQVPKDIAYNAFMLKVTEEFGIPVVVDKYEDAEGELITLGDNANIPDLATQLSFGSKQRPYAMKLFLRQAGNKRQSASLLALETKRRSSEGSDGDSNGSHRYNAKYTMMRRTPTSARLPSRRDSNPTFNIEFAESVGRGSMGDLPMLRRSSMIETHKKQTSGDIPLPGRRSSVDSDGDLLDEVSFTGEPWEPPFARTPHNGLGFGDPDALSDMLEDEYELIHGPRAIAPRASDSPNYKRSSATIMHVDIPTNNLHALAMQRGSLDGLEANPSTAGSSSSALKTPTRVSPMISPFSPEGRFANEVNTTMRDSPLASSGPVTFVEVPHRPSFESHKPGAAPTQPNFAPYLPSFHQQPFPEQHNHPPLTTSPPIFRQHDFQLADSSDIEQEEYRNRMSGFANTSTSIVNGGSRTFQFSESSEDDFDVMDTDGHGPKYSFNTQKPIRKPPQSEHTAATKQPAPEQLRVSPETQAVPNNHKITDIRQPVNKSKRAEPVSNGTNPKMQDRLLTTWKKGGLIGRGGFGSVYQGLLANGQQVAVKQLELPPDIDLSKNSNYISFMKEIDMLKTLQHPNIVRYIGSTIEGHTINVFLEFVSGGSIASMLAKYDAFDEPMMKLLAHHILRALSYLHENNIAHRDIKGANILVDTQGVAKLADFGCSKSITVKSSGLGENFQTMLGTPYWMAPEVMRQEGHGRMADIWSFGCTLIEMASGKPPWAKEYTQIFALLYEVGNSQKIPEIPERLSPALKDLLHQCFRRTPSERPTAKQLMKHTWFDDLEDDFANSESKSDVSSSSSQSGQSFRKKSGPKFTKSMSASLSLALQDRPRSITQLPETVILKIMSSLTTWSVMRLAETCARLRHLAQRNAVWMSLSYARWPKLQRAAADHALKLESYETDYWKRSFVARVRYDLRWGVNPPFGQVLAIKGHSKKVFAIQLLEGATKLISCAGDKKIKIWDIAFGHASSSSSSVNSTGGTSSISSIGSSSSSTSQGSSSSKDTTLSSSGSKKKKASTTLRGHTNAVTCFHAGTKPVLISGSSDGTMKVWDLKAKKCITTIRTGDSGLTALQFHEATNILVTANMDGVAHVWDLKTYEVKHTLTGHKSTINAIKFHGNILATASKDKRVKLWNLQDGSLIKTLHGHKEEVLCVDIFGDTVITGSADGIVLEWSINGNEATQHFYKLPSGLNPCPINCIHFDGVNTVYAGRADGNVIIWKYHTQECHSVLKVDSGAVTALTAYSQVLATAGAGDKIVKVWALQVIL